MKDIGKTGLESGKHGEEPGVPAADGQTGPAGDAQSQRRLIALRAILRMSNILEAESPWKRPPGSSSPPGGTSP